MDDERVLYLLDLLNNDPDINSFAFDTVNNGTDLVIEGDYIRVYAALGFDDNYIDIGGFEATSARSDRLEYYDFEAGYEAANELKTIIEILEDLNGTLLLM